MPRRGKVLKSTAMLSVRPERMLPQWITTLCNRIMCFVVQCGCSSIQSARVYYHPDVDTQQTQVLVSNHRSFLDPPLVGTCFRARVVYVARKTLWQVPIVAQVLSCVGALPVDPGKSSMQSMKDIIAILKNGRSILLFPEGTRTRDGRMADLSDGYAMIARRSNVPITPVYLTNTDLAWPLGAAFPRVNFRRMKIFIGKPVVPPEHLKGAERDRWVTTYVKRWMAFMEDRHVAKPSQSWSDRV